MADGMNTTGTAALRLADMEEELNADWREVEGAKGQCSAVWHLLDSVAADRRGARAISRMMLHLVTSDAVVEEEELEFLADTLAERLEAIEEAIDRIMRIARPTSQAERAAATKAEEVARRPSPEREAEICDRMAAAAAEMAQGHRDRAAIIGAEVVV